MWRAFAIVLALLTLRSNAAAQRWTDLVPVDASTMPEFQDYRTYSPNGYRSATGDFDGDGREDTAGFYLHEANLVLAVRFGAAPDIPAIVWQIEAEHARYFGVETAAPGVHRTACARYWRCDPDERPEVRLTHNGLFLLAFEGPAGFLYFLNDDGTFDHELIWE
jgi:hypothetical protein